jgi:hypothetical protein
MIRVSSARSGHLGEKGVGGLDGGDRLEEWIGRHRERDHPCGAGDVLRRGSEQHDWCARGPEARSRATAALSVPRVDSSPAIAMAGSQGDAIEIGPCNRSAALTAFAWIPPTSLSFSANSRATSRDRR